MLDEYVSEALIFCAIRILTMLKIIRFAGGNPVFKWVIIILAVTLAIAIIVAILVVALDKRPNEANKEELIPPKVFLFFHCDTSLISIIFLTFFC